MLIVCPSCSAEYEIDSGRIGAAGRKVRCAACRNSWFIGSPAGPLSTEPQADTASEPRPVVIEADAHAGRPGQVSAKRRRPSGRPFDRKRPAGRSRLAAALLVAAIAIVPAAVTFRAPLVRAAPRSAILFSSIGMPVNLVGLSFDDVASERTEQNGAPVLVVSGSVRNATGRPRDVPPVAFTIRGKTGELLYSWSIKAPRPQLDPGDAMPFQARLASPPPAGQVVEVSFGSNGGVSEVALR